MTRWVAPNELGFLSRPLDLVEIFGPMSAMHAAMEQRGVGMLCGLVARFQDRTAAEVEAAVEAARRRFTVLERRIVWLDARPALMALEPSQRRARASKVSLAFTSDPDGPLWRYNVIQDGDDAWLTAVWAHAAADGPSMLRFVETVGAVMTRHPVTPFQSRARPRTGRSAMPGWLIRFFSEQQLRRYVRPADAGSHLPGVAWLTIPPDRSRLVLQAALEECDSFAAWLAGVACTVVCEQQGLADGRVLLNVPILRDDLERVGGFGFGVGSLMMPVKVDASESLPSLARSIGPRLKQMTDHGWDGNFERFLGNYPKRHARFAGLRASGQSAPIVSVSWKGLDWRLGGEDGIRDVACFAVSPVVHISAHVDRNGLSLSVASSQPPTVREDFLRRVNDRLAGGTVKHVYAFDGHRPSATGVGSEKLARPRVLVGV